MFQNKVPENVSFLSVARAIILFGAAVFSVGSVEWVVSISSGMILFSYPVGKILASVIIIALGYILLELEIARDKK